MFVSVVVYCRPSFRPNWARDPRRSSGSMTIVQRTHFPPRKDQPLKEWDLEPQACIGSKKRASEKRTQQKECFLGHGHWQHHETNSASLFTPTGYRANQHQRHNLQAKSTSSYSAPPSDLGREQRSKHNLSQMHGMLIAQHHITARNTWDRRRFSSGSKVSKRVC